MIVKWFVSSALLAIAAMAQTPPPTVAVSGVVKDSVAGRPLAGYSVSTDVNVTWVGNTVIQGANTKQVTATTDDSGHYRLADLPPGEYHITARAPASFGLQTVKRVRVSGRDLENIDFRVQVNGTISGKVIDENKEPVPGAAVFLVSREYYLGSVGYFLKASGRTDDRGEYTIDRVQAGRPYVLVADRRDNRIQSLSEAPLDPRLRRRIPARTFYPNSPVKEGAMALTLRPGEHREGVDIEMKKSASFCVDGTLIGTNGPAAMRFSIEPLQPSSGTSNNGGMYIATPSSTTASDGRFRICDLTPGSYRLSASETKAGLGLMNVTIADEDVHNVKLSVVPGATLNGEVNWAADPPDQPVTARFNIFLEPLLRTQMQGEALSARTTEIPATFSLAGLLFDDYNIRATINSPGLYIKDVTYSGRSVLYEPFRFGSAMGDAGLRVTVGRDGGRLSVRVADKDNNPVADVPVLIMPADTSSEGVLAARIRSGQTDQTGGYSVSSLPPGKYYAIATEREFDYTPEAMDSLMRSRNRFKEVEIAPHGSAQLELSGPGVR